MAEQKTRWFGKIDIKISMNMAIVWAGVATILAGILILGFAYDEGNRTVYIFTASALGFLTGIVTLLARLHQNEQQLEQARCTAALGFVRQWTDPNFYEARRKGRAIYEELKATQRNTENQTEGQNSILQELRQQNGEKWSNFVDIANFFEALGIAVHRQQVDNQIITDFFRWIIVGYWNAFKTVIEVRRAERDNARLFRWFEELYKRYAD